MSNVHYIRIIEYRLRCGTLHTSHHKGITTHDNRIYWQQIEKLKKRNAREIDEDKAYPLSYCIIWGHVHDDEQNDGKTNKDQKVQSEQRFLSVVGGSMTSHARQSKRFPV